MSTHRIRLVTLLGSLRRNGCTRAIANTLDELAPDDVEVETLAPVNLLPHYNGGILDNVPPSVLAISNAVREADGVVIITPEYHRSIPGSLKNALDWLGALPQQSLAGKPVALQSASSCMLGGIRAQEHLRQVLTSLGAVLLVVPEVAIPNLGDKVDRRAALLRDGATRLTIAAQLAAFSDLVRSSDRGPSRLAVSDPCQKGPSRLPPAG